VRVYANLWALTTKEANMANSNTRNVQSADPPKLLTPSQLAEMLGVPVATLYAWRYHGKGPIAVRVGRHLRYRRDEVDAWIAHAERGDGRRR
jgi:excisionase family DNA binding protein